MTVQALIPESATTLNHDGNWCQKFVTTFASRPNAQEHCDEDEVVIGVVAGLGHGANAARGHLDFILTDPSPALHMARRQTHQPRL